MGEGGNKSIMLCSPQFDPFPRHFDCATRDSISGYRYLYLVSELCVILELLHSLVVL